MKILAGTNNRHKIGEFQSILQDTGVKIVSPDVLGISLPDIPEDGDTFEENAAIKALGFAKFAKMTAIADDSGLEIMALGNAPGIYSARYAETNDKRIEKVLRELEEKCQSVKVSECQSGKMETKRRDRNKANIEHRTSNIQYRSEVNNQRSEIENAIDWRPATDDWKPKSVDCRPTTDDSFDRAARFVCVIALADTEKVIVSFRGEVYGRIAYEPKGSGGFGYDPIFIPDGYDQSFAELGAEIKDSISHRANALKKLDEFLKNKTR